MKNQRPVQMRNSHFFVSCVAM